MAMELARNWRLREQRYRLEGNECETCGARHFPPRLVCPECRASGFRAFHFCGEGDLYSYTTLSTAPAGFEDQVPYSVGLVKLVEGPMLEAQLTDVNPEELHVGMPVEMVTRKLREQGPDGLILYGYKFRPRLVKRQSA